jgi:membrane protease YdiL (CAAX protease family)
MDGSDDSSAPSPTDGFFTLAVVFELGLGACGLLLGWVFGTDPRALIPSFDDPQAIGFGLGLGALAALPPLLVIYAIEYLPLPGVKRLGDLTKDRLMEPMREMSVPALATIALCAGVGEELLFRGWLQGWLIGSLETATPLHIWSGILLASLLFGLVHPITPTYVILASLIGIYLGWLMVATGNLLVPIAAHATYDAIQLLLIQRELNRAAD